MKNQSTESDAAVLDRLYAVLRQRKENPGPGSYTAALYRAGTAAIHAKIAEEADELIRASQQADREGIIHETADLWFHSLVLLCQWDILPHEMYAEFVRRWGISGMHEKAGRQAKPE